MKRVTVDRDKRPDDWHSEYEARKAAAINRMGDAGGQGGPSVGSMSAFHTGLHGGGGGEKTKPAAVANKPQPPSLLSMSLPPPPGQGGARTESNNCPPPSQAPPALRNPAPNPSPRTFSASESNTVPESGLTAQNGPGRASSGDRPAPAPHASTSSRVPTTAATASDKGEDDLFKIVGPAIARRRPPPPKSMLQLERKNPEVFKEVAEEAGREATTTAEGKGKKMK